METTPIVLTVDRICGKELMNISKIVYTSPGAGSVTISMGLGDLGWQGWKFNEKFKDDMYLELIARFAQLDGDGVKKEVEKYKKIFDEHGIQSATKILETLPLKMEPRTKMMTKMSDIRLKYGEKLMNISKTVCALPDGGRCAKIDMGFVDLVCQISTSPDNMFDALIARFASLDIDGVKKEIEKYEKFFGEHCLKV